MRVVKVQSGYSCWRLDMEPIPRIEGFLVQDNETVRFFNEDAFRPFDTDEVRLVDKLETEPSIRAAIDYLSTSTPRNTQRDRNARNRYFEQIFNI